MPASYVGFGAVASGQTSITPAYPTGVASGDLLVMTVVNKPETVTPTTPSGWTSLYTRTGGTGSAGGGTGLVRETIFVRQATSALSGTQTVAISSALASAASMVLFRKDPLETWSYSASGGSRSTSSTTWTNPTDAVIPFDSGDLYLLALARSANTTATGLAITATGSTFSAATERVDTGTTVSNDISMVVGTGTVSAGPATSVATITATMAVATYGVGIAVRITADPPVLPAQPSSATVGTAIGIKSEFTNAGTDLLITLPNNIPDGSWGLVMINFNPASGGTDANTITLPEEWPLLDFIRTSSSAETRFWSRYLNASDSGTQVQISQVSPTGKYSMAGVVLTDVNPDTMVRAFTASTPDGYTHTSPTATGSPPRFGVVALSSRGSLGVTRAVPPSGYSTVSQAFNTGGAAAGATIAVNMTMDQDGTVGEGTWQIDGYQGTALMTFAFELAADIRAGWYALINGVEVPVTVRTS